MTLDMFLMCFKETIATLIRVPGDNSRTRDYFFELKMKFFSWQRRHMWSTALRLQPEIFLASIYRGDIFETGAKDALAYIL